MNSIGRVFRVFVSSTFSDFQAEREALRRTVWPSLERYCQGQGATFQAIDLRWGIPPQAAETHEILSICLNEIARCQKLSPRPNFIMLLGDRYGWRPAPAEIPRDEFLAIRTLLSDAGDRQSLQLLETWYPLDENALPPDYCLLAREGLAESAWNAIEQRLVTVLRRTAETLGITPERRERYFLSATHQEIVQGVLRPQGVAGHVFAFRRCIQGWPADLRRAAAWTDLDADGRSDAESAALRGELWEEIRGRLPEGQRFHYDSAW